MSTIESIRKRLGVTQKGLADALGCTQSNVGHYIRGSTIPPDRAMQLVSYARTKGMVLSLDHVYGLLPLPMELPAAKETAHA